MIPAIILSFFLLLSCAEFDDPTFKNTGLSDKKIYQLIWSDDFDYPNSQLEPVYLSEAIISWAGEIIDAINGTSMDVDLVKVYRKK